MPPSPNDRSSTILKILVGLLIFNVIGIGLSEVQRRELARAARVQLAESNSAISELNKQMNIFQAELRSRRDQDRRVNWERERGAVALLLNSRITISIRLDDSPEESVGADSVVSCGKDTSNSYLGIFIAGQIYTVSFDPSTQRWRGTGPSQLNPYDPVTKTCGPWTAEFGTADLGETVLPESGRIVLWGSTFQVEGRALKLGGRKVGELLGIE